MSPWARSSLHSSIVLFPHHNPLRPGKMYGSRERRKGRQGDGHGKVLEKANKGKSKKDGGKEGQDGKRPDGDREGEEATHEEVDDDEEEEKWQAMHKQQGLAGAQLRKGGCSTTRDKSFGKRFGTRKD